VTEFTNWGTSDGRVLLYDQRLRSREASLLVGMRGGRDGRRVVLFNDGVYDGKNHTGIGIDDGASEVSQQMLLDSDGMGLASCEHGLLVAGRDGGVGDDGSELVRLEPPGGGAPQRVGEPGPGNFLDGSDTPCRDDRIYGLRQRDDTGSTVTLWSGWITSAPDGAPIWPPA
jgi:hypothetical protein